MPVRGIPDQLWPVHPAVQAGELMSSWLIRAAHANGYRVESLCTLLFGPRSSIWNRDFDRSASQDMIQRMARWGGCAQEDLVSASLKSLAGTLSEEVGENGSSPGLIPLGIYHRKRRRHGLMYCPMCLRQDDLPYFRKTWRIGYFTACWEHRCQLLDACPHCGAEVAPHRVDIKWTSGSGSSRQFHTRCHRCFQCLCADEGEPAMPGELLVARGSSDAIQQGWVNVPSEGKTQWVPAIAYFAGLQALARGIHKTAVRSGATAASMRGKERSKGWQGFDRQPLSARREIIETMGSLLQDWPAGFLSLAARKNMTYTDVTPTHGVLPYWVNVVVRANLFRAQAVITPAQRESVARATFNSAGAFGLSAARRLSGHSLAAADMSARWVARVDRGVCEVFLACLDQTIARTRSTTARLSVMEDKVMFALAWVQGLSQTQLSALTLDTFESHMSGNSLGRLPDFWIFPNTERNINAWLVWYLREVRPGLCPHPDESAVFVSATTGLRLSASAIGERFRQHCLQTDMKRQIPHYAAFVIKGQIRNEMMRCARSFGSSSLL